MGDTIKFEKGHRLNYKVKAKVLTDKERYMSVLYDCEGDHVWVPRSIHSYENGLIEIPEWFYNLKFK